MTRLAIVALAISLLAAPAFAHDPRPGPNGGLKVDAGPNHHAELLATGTTEVVVFLFDANDQPVPAAGYAANAILIVDGAAQRFSLEPADANRMVGVASVPVPAGVKGALRITAPDGTTAQAKY